MTELLTGARIADGTGAPIQHADVLIDDDRITSVITPGTAPGEIPRRDLTGLVLAPGFIDAHSHADNAPLLAEPDTTKILQGVTTEIVGNCGFSLAPGGHTGAVTGFLGRLFPPTDISWRGFGELFATTDAAGYVTNHCPLVGHGTLRAAATGMTDAAPDDDAMRSMRDTLEEGMNAGAFGLSSGLGYPPARYADTEELIELARVLGGNGLYATHMRNEGDQLFNAIDEALRIGEVAGRTHISHLKAALAHNWGKLRPALHRLRRTRRTGQPVCHDVYPYTASSTTLTAMLPAEYLTGDDEHTLARLKNRSARSELATAIERRTSFDRISVASTPDHRFEGRTLVDIAAELGVEPVQAMIEVLVSEQLKVSMTHFSMHEDDLDNALRDEHTMIGSDGLPPGLGGKPHPRMTGTFPRVLARYVRDRGVLTLPEAIRRMTSLPADWFGIPDRGVIAAGKIADLVAFDPDSVTDVGDYQDPMRPPRGIPWVCQAGRTVVDEGDYLGIRGGTRLRPKA